MPFPDPVLPGILLTTLHDHPLLFIVGLFVFVHAIGFYDPQNPGSWRKLLAVWRYEKLAKKKNIFIYMTQSVNAKAALRSLWETDVTDPSASQASTSSPPTPVGVHSCRTDTQFLTGRREGVKGGGRVVLFQLWLCSSASRTRIVCGYELSLRQNPFEAVVCDAPEEEEEEKKKIHWKWTTWRGGREARVLLSCMAV